MNVAPDWSAEKVNVALIAVVVAGSAGTSDWMTVRAGPNTVHV
jgi:hypothetical protein